MSGMYTVSFSDVAVTAAQDFFQLEALTNQVVIHAIYISQTSDVGDSAAENLTINLNRVTDALTNVTAEVKLNKSDGPALADLNVNDTTELVTGIEIIHAESWNIALPWIWLPTPEMRIVVPVDDVFTCTLMTVPADSLTMNGTLYFEEL